MFSMCTFVHTCAQKCTPFCTFRNVDFTFSLFFSVFQKREKRVSATRCLFSPLFQISFKTSKFRNQHFSKNAVGCHIWWFWNLPFFWDFSFFLKIFENIQKRVFSSFFVVLLLMEKSHFWPFWPPLTDRVKMSLFWPIFSISFILVIIAFIGNYPLLKYHYIWYIWVRVIFTHYWI